MMSFNVLAAVNSKINIGVFIYQGTRCHIPKDSNRHLVPYSSVMMVLVQ
jgi:hypothetical protein